MNINGDKPHNPITVAGGRSTIHGLITNGNGFQTAMIAYLCLHYRKTQNDIPNCTSLSA